MSAQTVMEFALFGKTDRLLSGQLLTMLPKFLLWKQAKKHSAFAFKRQIILPTTRHFQHLMRIIPPSPFLRQYAPG